MNDQAKKPRDLLVDLSDEGSHELRAKIFADPKTELARYGLTVPDGLLVEPRRPPPPPGHVRAMLSMLDERDPEPTHDEWKTCALLGGVIGAIPFVADDSR